MPISESLQCHGGYPTAEAGLLMVFQLSSPILWFSSRERMRRRLGHYAMYHAVMGRVALYSPEVGSQILLAYVLSSTLQPGFQWLQPSHFPKYPDPDSGCSIVQDRQGVAGSLRTYCGATEAVVQPQGSGPGAVLAHATPGRSPSTAMM